MILSDFHLHVRNVYEALSSHSCQNMVLCHSINFFQVFLKTIDEREEIMNDSWSQIDLLEKIKKMSIMKDQKNYKKMPEANWVIRIRWADIWIQTRPFRLMHSFFEISSFLNSSLFLFQSSIFSLHYWFYILFLPLLTTTHLTVNLVSKITNWMLCCRAWWSMPCQPDELVLWWAKMS